MNQQVIEAVEVKTRSMIARMVLVDLAARSTSDFRPVGNGEKVLGIMSEDLQRLHWVYLDILKEVEDEGDQTRTGLVAAMTEHTKLHVSEDSVDHDCVAFHDWAEAETTKLEVLAATHEVARSVFWGMLALEFPETIGKQTDLGVREGYQVVEYETKSSPKSVAALLASILR